MAGNGLAPSVQRAHWRAPEDAGLLRVVLDLLEVGVALLDARGEYFHRNRRFLALTQGAGEIPGLAETIQALLGEVLPKARALSGRMTNGPRLLGSTDVHVGSGGYRVQGIAFGRDREEREQALLITVERLPQEGAGRKLPGKLRLTARESRVARLLAEGCTNKEVAAELGIHPTTAKNHTQNVLQKLGVRRRSQVGPLLRTLLLE